MKHLLVLSDGTEISSGAPGTAILSVTLTRTVNSGEDLTLGSVCAAMAELTLVTDGDCPVAQGETFTLCRLRQDDSREQIGVFTAEKPRYASAGRVRITAYDNVTRLDRDMTSFLEGCDAWPYTLQELAQMVCGACGLDLAGEALPCGAHPVDGLHGSGITGRQILQWVGQATGRFCHADAQGKIRFDWYTESPVQVQPQGDVFIYQDTLESADYTVAPIGQVRLRQTEKDAGTVYPETAENGNVYAIVGNPLLKARDNQTLAPIAKALYTQLKNVCYTPCTVTVPADSGILAGQIVRITDRAGKTITAYVMQQCTERGRDTLRCKGNPSRNCVTAVNNRAYASLSGKVLELQADVDGLRAENTDNAGRTAALALDVTAISGRVTAAEEAGGSLRRQMTQLQQDAKSLQLQIRTVQENGAGKVTTETGYTFSDEGLRIQKSGRQMENLLDHTGMYVRRDGQTILQANHRGVTAADVTVHNFLCVGDHARFEDYGDGTACFYMA